jgi:hypothetical protein
MQKAIELATASVVQVGDGRGFVVEVANKYFGYARRLIITAAHCLPKMPPPITAMYLHEKTWLNLVGPLRGKPGIAVECLFFDPISDLAVLGPPDDQELYEQTEAYEAFLESLTPLPIAEAEETGEAWFLFLDKRWFSGRFDRIHWGSMWFSKLEQPIFGSMSGSPILNSEGAAIGVVNLGDTNPSAESEEWQTALYRNLAGWMLAKE